MKKISISAKTTTKVLSLIFANKNLLLILIFGGFLIYSFDVVYQNAYMKTENIDYQSSAKMFDGRRESALMSKITDSLKLKQGIIDSGLSEEHTNIFIYKDVQEAPPEGENASNSENDTAVEEERKSIPEVYVPIGPVITNEVQPNAIPSISEVPEQ